jgi:hypothetical protein
MNFKYFQSPKMNLDHGQVLYGKLVEFPQKKFGHQLVAAKLTKSNTAANTPLGLGFDFTMLILNQTIELKKKGKDRKAQSAIHKQCFFIKFCNQTYKYFVLCFLLYVNLSFVIK